MMKKICGIFGKNVVVVKVLSKLSSMLFTFKTMINLFLGRVDNEEEYIFKTCFKVLDNITQRIDILDEEFAQTNGSYSEALLKGYVLCFRCLEALRIIFIYSSSSYEIRSKIDKLQVLIEIRVKHMDKKAWVSILRHNANYGNSKTDIMRSSLISMFL